MNKNNTWYHSTTELAWTQIQKDGHLWSKNPEGKRHTYLTKSKDEAAMYGDIMLRVTYDPTSDLDNNNFSPETDEIGEIKVTAPILISNVKRIS
jgi:hypothetical protein